MVVAVVAVVVVVVVAVNLLACVSVSASCAFVILMVGWWVDWFVYVLAVITWSSLFVGWLVRYLVIMLYAGGCWNVGWLIDNNAFSLLVSFFAGCL